jgi:hypothetical protein
LFKNSEIHSGYAQPNKEMNAFAEEARKIFDSLKGKEPKKRKR